ncbi:hypothetical protein [Cohnella lupini]|uniref:Uncharacterized protein n=1 Tax=Cohnella lupini TaxID=1294267 RepID=A0A3D9HTX0_9BACL|nr:hypothetical protein [Cohnella lupini]RED52811.1 hypothetical protein DFP95_13015 [Cohnella lupini]
MIVVSRKRYLPVMVNTLVLAKEDWYYYIHRDVYDQATILADRFETLQSLVDLVGGNQGKEETVAWFYGTAPKPLHVLAPYLALIDGEVERDIELCCGVLHVITAMINVRSFILKPMEIRKSVSFSVSIREEYEMAWERFFSTSVPYEKRDEAAPYPLQAQAQPIQRAFEVPNVVIDEASSRTEKNATRKLLL